jgi:hypothetical protein
MSSGNGATSDITFLPLHSHVHNSFASMHLATWSDIHIYMSGKSFPDVSSSLALPVFSVFPVKSCCEHSQSLPIVEQRGQKRLASDDIHIPSSKAVCLDSSDDVMEACINARLDDDFAIGDFDFYDNIADVPVGDCIPFADVVEQSTIIISDADWADILSKCDKHATTPILTTAYDADDEASDSSDDDTPTACLYPCSGDNGLDMFGPFVDADFGDFEDCDAFTRNAWRAACNLSDASHVFEVDPEFTVSNVHAFYRKVMLFVRIFNTARELRVMRAQCGAASS